MNKIRIGNDIQIVWSIFKYSGEPYDLSNRNLKLCVITTFGREYVDNFFVESNQVKFTFYGKDQRHLGKHTLTLIENDGLVGMHTLDKCDAFCLVRSSCQETTNNIPNISIDHIELTSNLQVGNSSGDATIDVSKYVAIYEQAFSAEQKQQARTNIDAASVAYVEKLYRQLYDMIQGGGGGVTPSIAILDNAILDNTILS